MYWLSASTKRFITDVSVLYCAMYWKVTQLYILMFTTFPPQRFAFTFHDRPNRVLLIPLCRCVKDTLIWEKGKKNIATHHESRCRQPQALIHDEPKRPSVSNRRRIPLCRNTTAAAQNHVITRQFPTEMNISDLSFPSPVGRAGRVLWYLMLRALPPGYAWRGCFFAFPEYSYFWDGRRNMLHAV